MNAPTTQPQPTPGPVLPTNCPHCRGNLAHTQRGKHCPPGSNGRPHPTCTWLKCACGAVIDLTTGLHNHESHNGKPRHAWPCQNKAAA